MSHIAIASLLLIYVHVQCLTPPNWSAWALVNLLDISVNISMNVNVCPFLKAILYARPWRSSYFCFKILRCWYNSYPCLTCLYLSLSKELFLIISWVCLSFQPKNERLFLLFIISDMWAMCLTSPNLLNPSYAKLCLIINFSIILTTFHNIACMLFLPIWISQDSQS